MATSSTSAEVLSEDWFHQVNGLLDTVEVAGQTTQNAQSQPTGMIFFFRLRLCNNSLFLNIFIR